eukprot:12292228-Ditylum_brightwellii.AAC.1
MTAAADDTNTQQFQQTIAQTGIMQPTMTAMEVDNVVTGDFLQSTLDKLRADMRAKTEAAMAKFRIEMQNQVDTTIQTIISNMRASILVSVQTIMNESLAKLSAAGATTL